MIPKNLSHIPPLAYSLIADLIVTSEGIVNIKKTWELSDFTHCTTYGILFKTYSLKNHERNHTIFKHFGLFVPNLKKQHPARIRFRMTQKIILRGGPVFLKQSPQGWLSCHILPGSRGGFKELLCGFFTPERCADDLRWSRCSKCSKCARSARRRGPAPRSACACGGRLWSMASAPVPGLEFTYISTFPPRPPPPQPWESPGPGGSLVTSD